MSVVFRTRTTPQMSAQLPLGPARSRALTLPFVQRLRPNRYRRLIVNYSQSIKIDVTSLIGYKNQPVDLYILVRSGVTVQPTTNDTPAIDLTGIPAGSHVTIVNRGVLKGSGDYTSGSGKSKVTVPGYQAFVAPASCVINLTNFGTIAAGGTGTVAITNARNIKLIDRGTITGTINA